MKPLHILIIVMSLLFAQTALLAQPYIPDEVISEATAPSAIGVSILGNPSISISSISDYQNGVSISHNTLQLSVSLGLSWSLQVRATDDLRYQNQSIPVSSIAVQSLNLGNRPEIFLSTTNQTLSSGLASSILSIINLIRYRAVGGSNFLKPAGNYTTTILFTYTAL
ncbi:hypothetical protein [Spirosoma sp. KNUC1025]|uniref:hypothetical protein n=1 Tax=Spirosoma sp. KNUC1025 TaxID=2894082 RepID=UPI00386EDDF8|nr:hypothetical protein LN737_13360 [Spirosoma sp. KNUC1025]